MENISYLDTCQKQNSVFKNIFPTLISAFFLKAKQYIRQKSFISLGEITNNIFCSFNNNL